MVENDELLRTRDAARRLGLVPETIRRFAHAGRLPALRLPSGQYRFRAEDLAALAEPKTEVGPRSAAPDGARGGDPETGQSSVAAARRKRSSEGNEIRPVSGPSGRQFQRSSSSSTSRRAMSAGRSW